MITSRPPTAQRVAICALTRGYPDPTMYARLIERTQRLAETLARRRPGRRFECALILFHEGNISASDQSYIKAQANSGAIEFVCVADEFRREQQNTASTYCHETNLSRSFGHGYKCMCSFWLDGFLRYTQDYDYVVRVDEDCMLSRFDLGKVISRMRKKRAPYCSAIMMKASQCDEADVMVGLERFSRDFSASNRVRQPRQNPRFPYTNLFICDRRFYSEAPLFRAYAAAARQTGCITINRWGDMPLWGYYLSISGDRVLIDRSISYSHAGKLINRPWLSALIWHAKVSGKAALQALRSLRIHS